MKIPKYIDNALKLRTKYAYLLDEQMGIIDRWLESHDIKCETYDTHGGVEIYVHPYDSEARIREQIKKS